MLLWIINMNLEWISPALSLTVFFFLFLYIVRIQNKSKRMANTIRKLDTKLVKEIQKTKRVFEKANGSLERLTTLTESSATRRCPYRQGRYCTFNDVAAKTDAYLKDKVAERE